MQRKHCRFALDVKYKLCRKLGHFGLMIITLLLLIGCQGVNDGQAIMSPEAIDSIVQVSGNTESGTVIVYAQSGPLFNYNDSEFRAIQQHLDLSKVLLVNVTQAQIIHKEAFEEMVSFEEAVAFDQESVALLSEVVKYYRHQGRKVYVMGISFGAFAVQNLISEFGPQSADGFLIMAGRLNMPKDVLEAMKLGRKAYFSKGNTPVISETVSTDRQLINMLRLASGLGQNNCMEKWEVFDLAHITYVYGQTDEAVGSLTPEEIDFLKSNGAKVISDKGGHVDAIFGQLKNGLIQLCPEAVRQ